MFQPQKSAPQDFNGLRGMFQPDRLLGMRQSRLRWVKWHDGGAGEARDTSPSRTFKAT
jgi:hypothetical protein